MKSIKGGIKALKSQDENCKGLDENFWMKTFFIIINILNFKFFNNFLSINIQLKFSYHFY